jgi:hypothetical protein
MIEDCFVSVARFFFRVSKLCFRFHDDVRPNYPLTVQAVS